MVKRLLLFLLFLIVIAYMGMAVTMLNKKPERKLCQGILFSVVDSIDYGFINKNEISEMLKAGGAYPVHFERRDINVKRIESLLTHHPFIEKAECYLTSGNFVRIEVKQRVPVLHILTNSGSEYYLDGNGKIMSIPNKVVDVPLATGAITQTFARKELFALAKYLETDRFWNAQIVQINVTPHQDIELIPRVGEQLIFLGLPGNYSEKFEKLRQFYLQGLNKVGWNKYDTINIEFVNQIICTKKETKI